MGNLVLIKRQKENKNKGEKYEKQKINNKASGIFNGTYDDYSNPTNTHICIHNG